MPNFSRKGLRQRVGVLRLRECTLGTTQMAVAVGSFVTVMDPLLADLSMTGQSKYVGQKLRVASVDYRVASFNFQSGALFSQQAAQYAIASGADFELHSRLSAHELDLCLDEVLAGLRVQQEVGIPTVDGALYYTIDGAASPNLIVDVGNVYFFGSPNGSLDRRRRDLVNFGITNTATGHELRLTSALGGSQQIVLDALLEMTLAADDAATIKLDHQDWVLWGAAAGAYNLAIQNAPGQDSTQMEKRRAEAARMFTKLSGRRQQTLARRYQFDSSEAGEGRLNPTTLIDPF